MMEIIYVLFFFFIALDAERTEAKDAGLFPNYVVTEPWY